MKTVTVKGWLFVIDKGTAREKYFHSMTVSCSAGSWCELVMPCNFEVQVPDGDLTPVKVLADDAEFLAMRANLCDVRMWAV